MSEANLKTGSQALLVLCACLIGPGIYAVTRGTVTIQTFLLAPNCATNNTTDCCQYCLGISPQEYALSLALPTWFAFPFIFFSGAIIDFFGLPAATVMVSALSVSGALLHAVVVYVTSPHGVMLFIFSLGNLCSSVALFWFAAISQFLVIRYIQSKWRSLVISVIYSASTLGAVIAGLLSPRIAVSYGVDFSMWSMVLENAASPLAAGGIWLVFKLKEDVVSFESHRQFVKSNEVVDRSASFIFKSIKAFKIDYWLITTIIGLTTGSMTPYISNVPLIQTTLFEISKVDVAQGMSFGWLLRIGLLPVVGFFISFSEAHCLSAFFGMAVEAVMFVMIMIPSGNPLAANLMIALPYSVTFMSLTPLINPYVPEKALGLASSVSTALYSFCCSVMLIIAGVVLNNSDQRQGVHNCLYLLLGLLGMQIFLLTFLTLRLKLRDCISKEKTDYETLVETASVQCEE